MSGLTDGDIYRLDLFEGDEYLKEDVEVVVLIGKEGKGENGDMGEEKRRCRTYVYVSGEECLEGKEWSYEDFRREKLERWTGSSEEYKGRVCSL